MLGNDTILIKIDNKIQLKLANELPTDKIFGVWNGFNWIPAHINDIEKKNIKKVTLDNGIEFFITDDELISVGDTVYSNKWDSGNNIGMAMLGYSIGLFLNNGEFDGNDTIFYTSDKKSLDALQELWEMCGSSTTKNDDSLITHAKTVQTMIKRYVDFDNNIIRLKDVMFDTSGKFKLGFLEGICVPNDSMKWGRIRKLNEGFDNDIVAIIASLGLSVQITNTDIYFKSNEMSQDTDPNYHTFIVKNISDVISNEDFYYIKSDYDTNSYMLSNGIIRFS